MNLSFSNVKSCFHFGFIKVGLELHKFDDTQNETLHLFSEG